MPVGIAALAKGATTIAERKADRQLAGSIETVFSRPTITTIKASAKVIAQAAVGSPRLMVSRCVLRPPTNTRCRPVEFLRHCVAADRRTTSLPNLRPAEPDK